MKRGLRTGMGETGVGNNGRRGRGRRGKERESITTPPGAGVPSSFSIVVAPMVPIPSRLEFTSDEIASIRARKYPAENPAYDVAVDFITTYHELFNESCCVIFKMPEGLQIIESTFKATRLLLCVRY